MKYDPAQDKGQKNLRSKAGVCRRIAQDLPFFYQNLTTLSPQLSTAVLLFSYSQHIADWALGDRKESDLMWGCVDLNSVCRGERGEKPQYVDAIDHRPVKAS